MRFTQAICQHGACPLQPSHLPTRRMPLQPSHLPTRRMPPPAEPSANTAHAPPAEPLAIHHCRHLCLLPVSARICALCHHYLLIRSPHCVVSLIKAPRVRVVLYDALVRRALSIAIYQNAPGILPLNEKAKSRVPPPHTHTHITPSFSEAAANKAMTKRRGLLSVPL
jgi:hypothetical protein